MTIRVAKREIVANHPAGPGHFPGNPIVPGAVLLDEIAQAIVGKTAFDKLEIPAAKFFSPVRPGDVLAISWEEMPNGVIRFACSAGPAENRVATGTMRFACGQ